LADQQPPHGARGFRSCDNAGSLTNDGSNIFTYDDRARLKDVINTLGTVSYAVNGMGQRVKKVVGTTASLSHSTSRATSSGVRRLWCADPRNRVVGRHARLGAVAPRPSRLNI
jgi:hypothetical protein